MGSNNQVAWSAITKVISGRDGLIRDLDEEQTQRTAVIFVPVIVTRAPLFEVRLGNGPDLEVQQVPRSLLIMRTRAIDEHDGMWVVNEDDLRGFAKDAHASAQGLSITRD